MIKPNEKIKHVQTSKEHPFEIWRLNRLIYGWFVIFLNSVIVRAAFYCTAIFFSLSLIALSNYHVSFFKHKSNGSVNVSKQKQNLLKSKVDHAKNNQLLFAWIYELVEILWYTLDVIEIVDIRGVEEESMAWIFALSLFLASFHGNKSF